MNRRILTISIVFFFVPIVLQGYSPGAETLASQEIVPDILFVKKALDDGFYDVAERKLREMIKGGISGDDFWRANFLLGVSQFYQDKFEQAIFEFEKLRTGNQSLYSDSLLIYWIAECHYRLEGYEGAINHYQEIITRYPDSKEVPLAKYSMAWCQYTLGEIDAARKSLSDFIKEYPEHALMPYVQYKFAECAYEQRDFVKAQEVLEEFIKRYPLSEKIPDAQILMGEALIENGQIEEGVAYLEKSNEMRTEPNALVLFRLAESHFTLNEFEKARDYFRESIATGDPEIIHSSQTGLAQTYFHLDQIDQTAALCRDIIVEGKANEQELLKAYYWLGEALYTSKKYAEAIEVYNEALEIFPESIYADDMLYNLAWSYQLEGQQNSAVMLFEKIRHTTGDIETKINAALRIGDIHESEGKYKEALEYYDEILKNYPDNFLIDYAQYQVGVMFYRLRDYEGAIIAFKGLLLNFPNSEYKLQAQFYLGKSYMRQGDYDSARRELDNVYNATEEERLKEKIELLIVDIYYNNGEYGRAIKAYQKIIASRKEDDYDVRSAKYKMAWAYFQKGEKKKSLALFEEIADKYEGTQLAREALQLLGEYYFYAGDYTGALKYFEIIRSSYPDSKNSDQTIYFYGLTYLRLEKYERGVTVLLDLAQNYPESQYAAQGLLNAGDHYRQNQSIDKAIETYKKILELSITNELNRVVQKRIGESLHFSSKHSEAAAYFQRALGTGNQDTDAHTQYLIARSYDLQELNDQAVNAYLAVGYNYPEASYWHVKASLDCAQLFEKLGQFDKAGKLYRKIESMDVFESSFAHDRLRAISDRNSK